MSKTKTCTKCKITKDFWDDFHVSRSRKDGRNPHCKACTHAYYMSTRERQMLSNQKSRIKRRYGLEWEHYLALKQKGCAVCGSTKKLNVDHCHTTGTTRGILCLNCNTVLGHGFDDPERLRALANWLESGPVIGQGIPGTAY